MLCRTATTNPAQENRQCHWERPYKYSVVNRLMKQPSYPPPAYTPLPANLSGWSIIPFPDTKDGYYTHHSNLSGNPLLSSDDSVAFAAIKGDTVAIALGGRH
jgi:hypothetical protein